MTSWRADDHANRQGRRTRDKIRTARRKLLERLMREPPSPDRLFRCAVCGAEVHGRDVTLDERARATCHDCTGRGGE